MVEWRDLTWETVTSKGEPMIWATCTSVPPLTIYRLEGRSPWAVGRDLKHGDIAIFHHATLTYTGHVLGAMAFVREFQLNPPR